MMSRMLLLSKQSFVGAATLLWFSLLTQTFVYLLSTWIFMPLLIVIWKGKKKTALLKLISSADYWFVDSSIPSCLGPNHPWSVDDNHSVFPWLRHSCAPYRITESALSFRGRGDETREKVIYLSIGRWGRTVARSTEMGRAGKGFQEKDRNQLIMTHEVSLKKGSKQVRPLRLECIRWPSTIYIYA